MIKNFDLEKKVLSGILQHQDSWCEISLILKEEDFYQEDSIVHVSLFKLIRGALNNAESIDDVILINKTEQLKVSFPDSIDLKEYIRSLFFHKIPKQVFLTALQELKKFTLRRSCIDSYQASINFLKKPDPNLSYSEIVEKLDKGHNETISKFEDNGQKVVNLSEMAEGYIEGLSSDEDDDIMSPYPTINKIYGSIFKGGNITVIGARQKVGKMMPLHQKILTVNGWKDHGTIKVGDEILTPNGGKAKVIGYFPHQNKEIYRVTFEDGRFADCGEDHLWQVSAVNRATGLFEKQVISTGEIKQRLNTPFYKAVYIPTLTATIEEDKYFSIDPYEMGVLINKKPISEKEIPEIYFDGSFRQRERLLKGLLDSNDLIKGSSFTTNSEKLSNGFIRLIHSLGGKISLSRKPYFWIISFKFPRKLKIDKVEILSKKQDCACIKLDDRENLYITSDYIVTHNTTWLLDACLKTSGTNNIPVLHFDNGEMSEGELIFRMVSSMSGIPIFLLEKQRWRNSSYGSLSPKEVYERVRAVWNKIKKTKILYENVAGLSSQEMCSLLKRRYYSEVGRGNPMIFSFDYLKTDFANLGKGSEWAFVGKALHDFKQVISRELKFDGIPTVSMATSVQLNRSGITTNRTMENIAETETEAAIGLSDNIIQFASHFFLFRKKTIEERARYTERFGTHNLICLAARHLGEDLFAEINPIETPDGPKKNFINFKIENFNVQDCGDLRDINNFLGDAQLRVSEEDRGLF